MGLLMSFSLPRMLVVATVLGAAFSFLACFAVIVAAQGP